jgi:hypothetical protein
MELSDLTPDQARKLLAAVEPMMAYTACLTRRMQAERWRTTDSFYVQAHRAHDALHAMRILAHYNVCGLGGAGRQGEPPGTDARPSLPEQARQPPK